MKYNNTKAYPELMNKKGQVADWADLFLMLFLGIFFYVVFFVYLYSADPGAEAKARFSEVKKVESALDNLRYQLIQHQLEDSSIDERIAQSQVLAGKTITSCFDYVKKEECLSDIAKVAGGRCDWSGGCYEVAEGGPSI